MPCFSRGCHQGCEVYIGRNVLLARSFVRIRAHRMLPDRFQRSPMPSRELLFAGIAHNQSRPRSRAPKKAALTSCAAAIQAELQRVLPVLGESSNDPGTRVLRPTLGPNSPQSFPFSQRLSMIPHLAQFPREGRRRTRSGEKRCSASQCMLQPIRALPSPIRSGGEESSSILITQCRRGVSTRAYCKAR